MNETEQLYFVRQGDILAIKIDLNLDELTKSEPRNGVNTLVHGEVTGNTHGCLAAETALYAWDKAKRDELEEKNPLLKGFDNFFFENLIVAILHVEQPTKIRHEEHDPIALEPGVYLITRQREGDELNPRIVVD